MTLPVDSQEAAIDEAIQRIYTADYPEGTKRELKAFLAQEVNKARIDELELYKWHKSNNGLMPDFDYMYKRIKDLERLG